jgi:glutamate-ammonia-ligase adenylyltransferase
MPDKGLPAKSVKKKAAAKAARQPRAAAPAAGAKRPAGKPVDITSARGGKAAPTGAWPALPQPHDSDAAARGFERWAAMLAETEDRPLAKRLKTATPKAPAQALLAALFGNSPFLTDLALHEPAIIDLLLTAGPDAALAQALAALKAVVAKARQPDDLAMPLRIAKRRVALSIGVADIAGLWTLEQITGALSDFASFSVDSAMRVLLRDAAERGEIELPHPKDPCRDCGFVALGMGKLGARELNYSSDIDLIMLYDAERVRYRGRRSALECYIRLTQGMVRLLHDRTEDGYVFRTDLRLRPDPGSFPVVVNMAEAETYYESFGQNWERAAMIKARPVGGDLGMGAAFVKHLTPYVWRKNLDYAAIEDIQSIKRQIHAHKGHAEIAVEGHNIKLGRGGIREIEFFAQTQQLISGGRDTRLRAPPTCEALRALVATERLSQKACDELIADYRYLRKVEHRLQMIHDEQTHTLPDDPAALAQLGTFLGYERPAEFRKAMRATLERVKRYYDDLFAEAPALGADAGALVFTGTDDDPETLETLRRLGFTDPSEIAATVRGWHFGRYRAMRSERAREKLTAIMPQLMEAFSRTGSADIAFRRFDHFLSSLPAGVQLFALLQANPDVLDTLAEVLAAAPQLAEALAQNAALFDSLIEYADHPAAFDHAALRLSLQRQMQAARDFQDVLDWARRWTTELKLQVGIGLLRGDLDGVAAGAALATVADVVLEDLLARVEAEFIAQHGRIAKSSIALVGFGRLGSHELTLESDLDLVLIFDCPEQAKDSDGPRPLTPGLYFTRLCQRFINAITAMTGEGRLYEIDMRLRPSGGAGPIAISLTAFADYQRKEAWTWEHMALTRARVICGDRTLTKKIEALRLDILTAKRDEKRLLANVADMRERMARHKPVNNPWDLKQQRGGLVDLEFILQYLLLRHGATRPAVLQPNPLQALAALREAKLLDAKTAGILDTAARLYARLLAVSRMAGRDEAADPAQWPPALARRLPELLRAKNMTALTVTLAATQATVHRLFETLVAEPARPHLALAESLQQAEPSEGARDAD